MISSYTVDVVGLKDLRDGLPSAVVARLPIVADGARSIPVQFSPLDVQRGMSNPVVIAPSLVSTGVADSPFAGYGFFARNADECFLSHSVNFTEFDAQVKRPMPSQARQGWREGVTTRGEPLDQRCGPHEPPPRFRKREDIASSASNTRCRRRIKSRCAKTWTTIQSRSRKLQDNVTNNNAFLRELKKENVRPVSGGNVIFNRSH